ncbi:MAG: hypothetical protein ABR524_09320, partial [Thermoanaerobaculia bacterium]
MASKDQVQPHPQTARLDKAPMIAPGHTFGSITDKISSIVLSRQTPVWWFIGFGIAFLMLMMLMN